MTDLPTTAYERMELEQVENAVRMSFKILEELKCGTVTPTATGITLDATAPMENVRKLLRNLAMGSLADQAIGTMRNFYIGDVLNQGDDIYGEEWGQVYGTDTAMLEPTTLSNISWIARRIAPAVRKPLVYWSLHQEVAPLPPEEQKYYLNMADDERKTDGTGYRMTVLDAINRDKCNQIYKDAPEEQQERILEAMNKLSPKYTKLNKWVKGEEPWPVDPKPLAQFCGEQARAMMDNGWTGGSYEELLDVIMQMAEAIKGGAIK